MLSIEEREKNLFNATDTLAQFYDEIETFLAILFGHMKRAGYTSKGDRLRSGTSGIRNLTRRLLATAIVVYVKGGGSEDTLDDEEEQDDEDQDAGKGGKAEILISAATRVPFVQIAGPKGKHEKGRTSCSHQRLSLTQKRSLRPRSTTARWEILRLSTRRLAHQRSPNRPFSRSVVFPIFFLAVR